MKSYGSMVEFSGGVLLSSVTFFYALHTLAGHLHDVGGDSRELILLAVLSVLTGAEAWRIYLHKPNSFGLRRQAGQFARPMLWGLDTGIPLSTIRATILPVTGVALSLFGTGGPWLGVGYGGGFVGAVVVGCFLRVSCSLPESPRV